MASQAPLYDLMLLLSPETPDEQRAKVLSDVQSAIVDAGGSVQRGDHWGRRPLAYPIRHQPEAEYHLLQFRSPPQLIQELSHTLRITDGVVRFRVIKSGSEAPPPVPPPVVGARADGRREAAVDGPSETASERAEPAPGEPAAGE
jgi:small subunit ribosomal protein S6